MPPISVLIKPSSGNCNLQCKYCFYEDVSNKRETHSYGFMTMDTLEIIIKKVLEFADEECTFAFQGGEPTLVGLDFYKNAVELQNRLNRNHVKIHNSIQTNGILLNEEWAKFFAYHEFLVGVSLDGNKRVHDIHRVNVKQQGTFRNVMQAIDLLKKYKVTFNILTVVTRQVAEHIEDIFAFYQKKDLLFQQYIPCLDPLFEERGEWDYSLTPQLYGSFLKKLFDLWYDTIDTKQFVYIRYFDNLLRMIKGIAPENCGLLGTCMCQFVIEADGSVYPCDFYVLDGYRLGYIQEQTILKLYENCGRTDFIHSSRKLPMECKMCNWFQICQGGCRRDRELESNGGLSKNYYCEAYKEFYQHAIHRLVLIARQI